MGEQLDGPAIWMAAIVLAMLSLMIMAILLIAKQLKRCPPTS
jgi:hypothetical protein